MSRAFGSLAACLLLASACSVAAIDQAASTIAHNECSSSSECVGGDCEVGECRSHSGTLQHVLFEVTPPADASVIAGVQFLRPLDLSPEGDDAVTLDLGLISQVVGEVKVVERRCVPKFVDDKGKEIVVASNGSIPATITLIPKTSVLGLYSPRAIVQSGIIDASYFGFSVNVPPGRYDVYVEPKHQQDETCPVPPQLLRDQTFNGGALGLSIKLPEPSTFEFHVNWPLADGALNRWLVDMVDPTSGRVISNRVQLALGTGGKADYVATVSYLPVIGGVKEQATEQLLRLSPPDGTIAPTVLLARSALGLFDAGHGVLNQFISLPVPVQVQGQVTDGATPRPVAATVTLVATKLGGVDPGVLASFVRTVDVGANGNIDVPLLPGTYRVSAVPRVELSADAVSGDSTLAAATAEWVVASTPDNQAGKVVELGTALAINGQAVSGTTALATAQVSAITSATSVQSDVLHQSLGETSLVPRASSGSVGKTGEFAFRTDKGTFDISVRPLPNTGFGWLVLPSVPVGTLPQTSNGVSFGLLQAPLPVSYGGTVTVPGSPASLTVPGALIRAYIYTKAGSYTADELSADSVLQIAETRANKSGNFQILIPASLNSWDTAITP